MTKKKLKTEKIINSLKTSLSYTDLVTYVNGCLSTTNKIMNLNLQDPLFSKKGKFYFPYSSESAFLILTHCTLFTNSKDLITSYYFKGILNLHKSSLSLINENEDYSFFEFHDFDEENFKNSEFAQSRLSQNEYFSSLKIANWSYKNFVVSATFFYLDYIHSKCLMKKMALISANAKPQKIDRAFRDLEAVSSYIALLLLNKIFGKKLFFTLKKTNFFVIYPKIWLHGFSDCLKNTGYNAFYDYETQQNTYFFNKIQKK